MKTPRISSEAARIEGRDRLAAAARERAFAFQYIEVYKTAGAAIAARPGKDHPAFRVISWNGQYYLVRREEAQRIEAAGVEFAYYARIDMGTGEFRIMSCPVNEPRY